MRYLNLLMAIMSVSLSSCYYEDIPRHAVCMATDLVVSATPTNTSGCGNSDGSIAASATGASGSYAFSIDGGKTTQPTGNFQNLDGGTYLVIVYDGACSDSTEVTVGIDGTDFSASVITISADTECLTDNGSVELQASGGTEPYSFTLGSTTNSTGIFSGLKSGTYSALASDANCTLTISVTIPSNIQTSYEIDVAPILQNKCNYSECHGNNNTKNLPEFTAYTTVYNYRDKIRSKIVGNAMPKPPKPDLTSNELNLIVCWIDAGAQNN